MIYQIKNWDKYFEKAQSRRCEKMSWVAIPNKHDGKSFRRLAQHERNVDLFAAWILILEVASKMPERGLLVDEDGPLDEEDLADMTGFPAEIFHLAFTVLTDPKIDWIERVAGDEIIPGSESARSRLIAAMSYRTGQDPTGQ